ncbi:hypothetical protein SeMB42_g04059 [Synchytrium endobioticum]|uniref:Uncharacterized protein n=1 Tax=Synchytrium endobioticum TaxID=286115 RepID=A0A507CIC9_9FUNG|nr:hypothetical protein SeLEV6574_g07883 [Synchytrium endobioticum]TPX45328.1 hypothetical protein SeMB42_g04059 [Synchytrium endobioticum]
MVNTITVGVATLLIFVTFSQSAPAEPGDEDIREMVRAFSVKRRRTITVGITALAIRKGLAEAVEGATEELTRIILGKVNTRVSERLPEHYPCTVAETLNPSGFEDLSPDQNRIARAYLSYVFEKLKYLFLYLQSYVPRHHANPLALDRLLAGLALVWDVLVVYYILDDWCRDYVSRLCEKSSAKAKLPTVVKTSYTLNPQPVSELSRAMALHPEECCDNLRTVRELRLAPCFQAAIAKLHRENRMAPLSCAPQRPLSGGGEAAQQDYNMFNQPNAYGNVESFPLVIDLVDDSDKSTPNLDNRIEYFNLLENNIDHKDRRDQPTPELVDLFRKAEEQGLQSSGVSLGMYDAKRLKGTTLRIEEPSPQALSFSHWHHSESSSHRHDKRKRPMHADGATDLDPTQQVQGGLDGRPAHGKSRLAEGSKVQLGRGRMRLNRE